MAGPAWVTISLVDDECWRLEERGEAFSALSLTDTQTPDFITLIGGSAKARLLRELTVFASAGCGHVSLIPEPRSCRSDAPRIFVDCELHRPQSMPQQLARGTPRYSRDITWGRQCGQTEIARIFYDSVLAPLSSVVCYFAADLGGLRGVAKLIAEQLASGLPSNRLQHDALPRVLVVVDTTTCGFDAWSAEARLQKELETALQDIGKGPNKLSEVLDHFREIRVLGLHKDSSPELRSKILLRRIASVSTSVQSARRSSRTLFASRHAYALFTKLIDNFCIRQEPFDFIKASRAAGFCAQDFPTHLKHLLDMIPSDVWLWHTVVPLVASALFLASYPPGSHCKFAVCFRQIGSDSLTRSLRFCAQERFFASLQRRMRYSYHRARQTLQIT